MGDASKVVPIDKLSVVITLVLAFIVLHEEFTTKSVIGCILIGAGTLLMVLQHNFHFKGGDLEMYAQAIRTPPVYRHWRANNQAHLNMFKGCAFSNEPCDCIKSLKLGDTNPDRMLQSDQSLTDSALGYPHSSWLACI